jgi:tripartite ATP-independent transporter DctM subunit
MSSELFVLLMFPSVILAILIGFPLAFSLMGVGLIYGFIGFGETAPYMLTQRVFEVMSNYVLAAVALFVFMGIMLERSEVADKLFSTIYMWTGRLRGGLAIGTVIMCTIFAAATGIIGASVVVIGLLAIPSMLSRKYSKELICGVVCAGGSLGTIIPPSVVIVVYGPIAGLSVGKLLIGSIFPGLLLSLLYITFIAVACFIRPSWGPAVAIEKVPFLKKIYLTGTSLIPPVALIVAVMGTILLGLAAPTEAASLGALGTILLAIGYRKFSFETLKKAAVETLKISSMIMMILTAGTMYTSVFLGLGGGELVENIVMNLNLSPWGVLFLFLGLIFAAGFILDWVSILLIFVPIFTPIVDKLGFDSIWFAILFLMMIQTSYLTPPMAGAIFYLKGIVPPEITVRHMYRGIIYFVLLQVIGIALVIIFPQISLWLPSKMVLK